MRWVPNFRGWRRTTVVLAALVGAAGPFMAASGQEFVRQELLVAQFRTDSTPKLPDAARELAELTRDRLERLIDRKQAHVVEGYRLTNLLRFSDYDRKTVFDDTELRNVTFQLRADETLFGVLARRDSQYVVTARMARNRNWGTQQPLPVVRAASLQLAADQLAREFMRARAQITGLRRCENALLVNDYTTAAREARRAIDAYPQATIARSCLLSALFDEHTPADIILAVADTVLTFDARNSIATISRARALETLRRQTAAADAWSRVFTLHADSLPLALMATEALMRLQHAETALRNTQDLVTRYGPSAELQRLAFRALAVLARWPATAALGDTLERNDSVFRTDSNYVTRYIEALRQVGDTIGALEIGARAVRRHPGDARIYLQYLQLLNAEQPAALPRALARFPTASEFRLLAANSARRAGDRRTAIRATREAVERDSATLTPYLALAEDYLQEQRPDSAAQVLLRAPRTGPDADRLRSYVLARGVSLLRTAGNDSLSPLQQTAVTLIALADSVRSDTTSRSVLAAAALQLARAHLVVVSRTKGCPLLDPFDGSIALATHAIEAGIGDGPSTEEIRSAHTALQAAADATRRRPCQPTSPTHNP